MTDSNVGPPLIKKTQDTLGKCIKKPSLTEKLLNKPPFRFLFDIFNAVIRETGCFEGLYSAEEQNIDNIKTREDKMKHLQKMIDVIEIIQARSLHIRASKIVAGQEADKTNELLQAVADVVKRKLNWREAVKAVVVDKKSSSLLNENKTVNLEKNTVKNRKSQKASKEISKEIKKYDTGKNVIPGERKSNNSLKEKHAVDTKARKEKKNNESIEKSPLPNDMELKSKIIVKDNVIPLKNKAEIKEVEPVEVIGPQTLPQDNVKTSPRKFSPKNEDKLLEPTSPKAIPSQDPNPQRETIETNKEEEVQRSRPVSQDHTSNFSTSDMQYAETEKYQRIATQPTISDERENPVLESSNMAMISSGSDVRKRESTFTRENSKGSNIDSVNKHENRPQTSLRPPSARPPSARPAAPRRRDKNVEIVLQPNEQIKMADINVKMERFQDFENDDEHLVILESDNASESVDNKNASKAIEINLEQKGHLVQQILETQNDLMPQHNLDEKMEKDSELTSAPSNNLRQSSEQQLANLRDIIQNLTKSVNPFGKLMDFIPEDIDEMQLELNMWRDSYAQSTIELKKEKSLTEAVIGPVKHQLTQIAADIAEYNELIDSSRAKIIQNSEKIMNMLLS